MLHARGTFALAPLLAVSLAVGAHAADFGALQPTGYVSDFAGVVDGQLKQQLEQYCGRVEASTGAQIALVTLPTLGGEPVEDVANLLFRKWGVGSKKSNEGILVLLVIQDRRSRVEVGYGLEPIIPDGFAGSILRDMRPALRERRYGAALAEAANTIGTRIAQAKNVQIGMDAPRRRVPQSSDEIPWPILIGLGALFLLFLFIRSAGGGGGGGRFRGGGYGGGGGMGDVLAGAVLGQVLGGAFRGGRGGGGFGGFDSGGGFGGFGGGDSGGGGASGSW
jgi:uncharacterized protein